MASFYDDNDDLRWYVDHGIDWEPLLRWTEYDYRAADGPASLEEAVETYKELLGLVGQFAAESIAPRQAELAVAHARVEDGEVIEAPVVTELMGELAELGLHGLCVPRELGGLGQPLMLFDLNMELFARADTSMAAHVGFHGGLAMAALTYSVLEGSTTLSTDPVGIAETRFAEVIESILTGETWGSMDITEPDAGSDMAALRTRGVLGEDGIWRVSGSKIFITSGHGRWHFVIARTDEGGLEALSMFLVPAWTDTPEGRVRHAVIDGVEHKLGHDASATVALTFEDAPAQLIGEPGEGFRYMLLLMNGARIGVGFEALGVAEAARRKAVAYAAERHSMGKPIARHELIAEKLEDMQTDCQAIRALAVQAAWHEELAQKLRLAILLDDRTEADKAELERERAHHARKARHYTPLLKFYAAEAAVDIARASVQIHGGMGYIVETGVEKLLRDAMVFPIYEGTTQIQALMAMKDALLGAVKDPRRFLARAALARWRSVSGGPLERRVAGLRSAACQAQQFLLTRLAGAKMRELPLSNPGAWAEVFADWDPKRDFSLALLHAERLAMLLHDAAVAEVLLRQSQAHPERTELLVRWLERAEPRSRDNLFRITTQGQRLLARLAPLDAAAAK